MPTRCRCDWGATVGKCLNTSVGLVAELQRKRLHYRSLAYVVRANDKRNILTERHRPRIQYPSKIGNAKFIHLHCVFASASEVGHGCDLHVEIYTRATAGEGFTSPYVQTTTCRQNGARVGAPGPSGRGSSAASRAKWAFHGQESGSESRLAAHPCSPLNELTPSTPAASRISRASAPTPNLCPFRIWDAAVRACPRRSMPHFRP